MFTVTLNHFRVHFIQFTTTAGIKVADLPDPIPLMKVFCNSYHDLAGGSRASILTWLAGLLNLAWRKFCFVWVTLSTLSNHLKAEMCQVRCETSLIWNARFHFPVLSHFRFRLRCRRCSCSCHHFHRYFIANDDDDDDNDVSCDIECRSLKSL